MILEQSLINPNFVGKDGFRWFLGLTSGEVDQYNNYGTRAKIRILGYHGEDIPDPELPWAHVLTPLTMGGGSGGSMAQGHIKPSTLVIGFFADGDDGQQPIVIGAFYNGDKTEFPASFSDGTKYLKMFQTQVPPSPFNRSSDGSTKSQIPGVPEPSGTIGIGTTGVGPSAGTLGTVYTPIVNRPGHCKNAGTGYNKILGGLKNLIGALNTVNQVANGFINPLLNSISNIGYEIEKIGSLIANWLISQFKIIRDKIINAVYTGFKKLISQIKLPPWLEKIKAAAVGKLTDGIWCAIGKILKKIKDYIIKFLFGLIGNIVSIPLCAAGAFIGSAIQTITNEITKALGPILDQVSSLIGPIGTVTSYVSQAIGYAKQLYSFLDCDDPKCDDQYDLKMNVGFIPKNTIDDFQKVINYSPSSGVDNLLNDASGNVSRWLGDFGSPGAGTSTGLSPELAGVEPLLADCNVFSFEYGPPTVSIFGGGGSGAYGNVVIDATGGILGVNITNPGSGYIEPPYVTFEDPSNNGSGAYGIAKIGPIDENNSTIGVTGVVMYYSGSGYLGPSTTTDPFRVKLFDETGSPVTTTDLFRVELFDETGSPVTATISEVIIENTGIGYASSDKIYDAAYPNDVEMYPIVDNAGRIIDVNIVNPGISINIRPELQINSQNGYGAVLIPSLTFKPISGVTTETSREKVKTVIYCAEDHAR